MRENMRIVLRPEKQSFGAIKMERVQGVYVVDGFVVDAYLYKEFKQPEIRVFATGKNAYPSIVDMNIDKVETEFDRKKAFVYYHTGRKIDGMYEYKFKGVVYV